MVKEDPRESICTTAKSKSDPARERQLQKEGEEEVQEVSDHVKDEETSEASDEYRHVRLGISQSSQQMEQKKGQ